MRTTFSTKISDSLFLHNFFAGSFAHTSSQKSCLLHEESFLPYLVMAILCSVSYSVRNIIQFYHIYGF